MKKIFSILILFFVCFQNIQAQKGIDSLVQAEKNFAAYSVANSTKEAFLKFLDSAGIIFNNGKPANGIMTWKKREKGSGVLNWHPQFAEISGSGDFGYTTGPWTLQNSSNDTVVARGQYTTVWQINAKGEWKFLVDLGVGNTPPNLATEVKKIDVGKRAPSGASQHDSPVIAENNFLVAVSKDKSKAYKKYLSAKSILNRNGYLPATTSADQKKLLDLTSSTIQYKLDGAGMSSNMDLGYTYGTSIINGKTDNYLRIWRWEKDEWKIALEVLRY
jgi:ketosteroid isomerase-like protein